MNNKQAIVNLFEFSRGITIILGDEAYNIINCNAEGILQMVHAYDIDEIVLVGPGAIAAKYEKDLKSINIAQYSNKNYKITIMEG